MLEALIATHKLGIDPNSNFSKTYVFNVCKTTQSACFQNLFFETKTYVCAVAQDNKLKNNILSAIFITAAYICI
jgi:hypothetical protein